MIGDTLTISQADMDPWATLPGETDGEVVLSKVNQDSYGSEYRRDIPDVGRYIARVRNSVEPATANRGALNRHNVEINFFPAPSEPGAVAPPPLIVYAVFRTSANTDVDLKLALAYALFTVLDKDLATKVFNFES